MKSTIIACIILCLGLLINLSLAADPSSSIANAVDRIIGEQIDKPSLAIRRSFDKAYRLLKANPAILQVVEHRDATSLTYEEDTFPRFAENDLEVSGKNLEPGGRRQQQQQQNRPRPQCSNTPEMVQYGSLSPGGAFKSSITFGFTKPMARVCCGGKQCPHVGGVCCGGGSYCCPFNWICVRQGSQDTPSCFNILGHPGVAKVLNRPGAKHMSQPEKEEPMEDIETVLIRTIEEERHKMDEIDKREDEELEKGMQTATDEQAAKIKQETNHRAQRESVNRLEAEQENKSLEEALHKKEIQMREASKKAADKIGTDLKQESMQKQQSESAQKSTEEQAFKAKHEGAVKTRISQFSRASEIGFKAEAEQKRAEEVQKRGVQEGRDKLLQEQDKKRFIVEAQTKEESEKQEREASKKKDVAGEHSYKSESNRKVELQRQALAQAMTGAEGLSKEMTAKKSVQDSLRAEQQHKAAQEVEEKQEERKKASKEMESKGQAAQDQARRLILEAEDQQAASERDHKLLSQKHQAIEAIQKSIQEEQLKSSEQRDKTSTAARKAEQDLKAPALASEQNNKFISAATRAESIRKNEQNMKTLQKKQTTKTIKYDGLCAMGHGSCPGGWTDRGEIAMIANTGWSASQMVFPHYGIMHGNWVFVSSRLCCADNPSSSIDNLFVLSNACPAGSIETGLGGFQLQTVSYSNNPFASGAPASPDFTWTHPFFCQATSAMTSFSSRVCLFAFGSSCPDRNSRWQDIGLARVLATPSSVYQLPFTGRIQSANLLNEGQFTMFTHPQLCCYA